MEKYLSFSLIKNKKIKNKESEHKKTDNKKVKDQSLRQELRFIDSAQFMLSSLDKLVSATSNETMEITATYETDLEERALLLRKGV